MAPTHRTSFSFSLIHTVQVNQQYVALASLQGEEGRLLRKEQLAKWARIQEAKKRGIPLRELPQIQSKLQRMKTYILGMNLINMMKQAGVCISLYVIKEDKDGVLPCPFTWCHFNAALDRGSDCVCLDHAFAYFKSVNSNCAPDQSHGTDRVGKGALKEVGLWSHQVCLRAVPCRTHDQTDSRARLGWARLG